ncbi:MAG: ATP-binding protein [Bacillota bacterium]
MELTVLSGKGGTGKTMITVALAELFPQAVIADCDVDAPNLYLYYRGMDIAKESFTASHKAVIAKESCIGCGICDEVCRFAAIRDHTVDEANCEGCGACVLACPEKSIQLRPQKNADVFLTQTKRGVLSRAKMAVGSDGSGKLVSHLRKNAREYLDDATVMLLDGSPGIGCPVISSITGASMALIVTEPTLSGMEDFGRVLDLCEHFSIPAAVCVNKWDINPEVTDEIRRRCKERGIPVVGEIPFDTAVTDSINTLQPITSYPDSAACKAVLEMWDRLQEVIAQSK